MCGIVGVLAYGEMSTKKEEKLRQEAMIFLTTELLQLTQQRGKDATGLATLFADGDYMGLKMGVSAQEFITRFGQKETDYDGYLNVWRKKTSPAKIVIGHCRKPSTAVGAGTEDNNNNHPIKVGDIIGLHNGTLTNHEKIFENLKCGRDSKVDSEAIFRLLNHLTNSGADPFTKEVLQETCMRLGGTYSCLAFNGNNPYQLVGFRDGRPMVFGIIKPLKLFLIASDVDYLKIVATRYNKMAYLYMQGAYKYPNLRKGDFDTHTTLDDSLFMFDTSQDITPESKLEDLFYTEKVPRNNKIWAKESKAWNNNKGRATGGAAATTGAGAAGAKKTEVNASSPGKGAATHQKQQGQGTTQTGTATGANSQGSTNGHRVGRAWNRSSNMFEDVGGAKKTVDEHGAVLMNIDSGSITDEATGKSIKAGEKKVERQISSGSGLTNPRSDSQRDFSLQGSATPVDDLIADPAKIVVADVNEPISRSTGAGSNAGRVGTGVYAVHKGGRTVIPSSDLSTDVDALEKALEATENTESFSNNEELADALQVLDASALVSMPHYSLANRIKKFFFKQGWYEGYLEGKKQAVPVQAPSIDRYAREMLKKTKSKMRSSSATIRSMKVLTDLLFELVDADEPKVKNGLAEAVYDAYVGGVEINPEALEKVFRAGDLKKNTMVAHAIEAMKEVKK